MKGVGSLKVMGDGTLGRSVFMRSRARVDDLWTVDYEWTRS